MGNLQASDFAKNRDLRQCITFMALGAGTMFCFYSYSNFEKRIKKIKELNKQIQATEDIINGKTKSIPPAEL